MPVASSSARTRGFTVVEMMIVVAILSILLMMGLPSYQRWIANTQVRTAAESIQNGLRLAASEAVRRNVQVDFVLTSDAALTATPTADVAGGGWVVRVPGTAELVDSKPAAEASQAVVVASTAAMVSFSGLGRLTAGGACIRFTNPPNADRPLLVMVATGGQVRMCDPAFGPTDPRGCQTTPPC